ncbi:MAG: hypothetical protein EBU67_08845 [Actinobacteria bacterium]|nr:hypothetical protein [Actinomycetota bacterium]
MTAWLALSGCAVTSVRDTNKIRSAEELADSLLTEEDLSGDWALTMGPDGVALPASGVITDVEREMLPQVELCAEAGQAARDAIDSLKWQGFRQLDKVVDDPIDPPADREGHMEFVQQFLMSADPDDLESGSATSGSRHLRKSRRRAVAGCGTSIRFSYAKALC